MEWAIRLKRRDLPLLGEAQNLAPHSAIPRSSLASIASSSVAIDHLELLGIDEKYDKYR